jgi:membrane protein YdbS with pleckstrin-like domain
VWTLAITPRQARSYGYQLRRDDLVFRRGILWQRMVAVPYGRMQLIDITHGPLDRGFGIAQVKLVTAAATTGVVIPGLTQEAAERLRDTLIDVAETRRTGL